MTDELGMELASLPHGKALMSMALVTPMAVSPPHRPHQRPWPLLALG